MLRTETGKLRDNFPHLCRWPDHTCQLGPRMWPPADPQILPCCSRLVLGDPWHPQNHLAPMDKKAFSCFYFKPSFSQPPLIWSSLQFKGKTFVLRQTHLSGLNQFIDDVDRMVTVVELAHHLGNTFVTNTIICIANKNKETFVLCSWIKRNVTLIWFNLRNKTGSNHSASH